MSKEKQEIIEVQETMNIYEKLTHLQNELKAPKNQYNSFGKYSYRNAEDILEAVKPLLKKYNLAMWVQDDIEVIGDRFYVRAVVKLRNTENSEELETSAYAREELSKKGMDGSQVTGASSSYARKYALNALFAIDDTKDADFSNTHDEEPKKQPTKQNASKATKKQVDLIMNLYDPSDIEVMLERLNKNALTDLTVTEASKMISHKKGETK